MKYYVTNENVQFKEAEAQFTNKTGLWNGIVKVYPSELRQEIIGFGGAFTEASAYTYSKMSEAKQQQLVEQYFGQSGNKYNFCRTHIQSCDFALGNYAYIDDPKDTELKTFNLERDNQYIIPLIKEALKLNPDIQFLASPWSPPAFMKTTETMNNGGSLKKEYYKMWADMMAKYVAEYDKLGIKISRITVQNEPEALQTWDSCLYTALEEAEFACDYLKKSLTEAGYENVKISIWDHNKDIIIERITTSMSYNGADKAIDGIAFHWYTGDHFEALAAVKEKYPNKEFIFTEGCVEYSRFKEANQTQNAEMYAHDIIGNFNCGMNGYIDWNIYLDEKGGPNHVNNFCDAPIMCNTTDDSIDTKLSFYYIGHFSRFVKQGAKRIIVSRPFDKIETVGFLNPDGERVVVVMNRTDKTQSFALCEGEKMLDMSLDAHSIMTVCWK